MTSFTITNGDARAVLASLLPHAGKESKDTPELGRIRFAREAERLHAWASDYITHAAASAVVIDQLDGELDSWDLTVETVRAVLAVFKGPSDPDQREMWNDGELRVTALKDVVVFDEVGTFVDGRSLTVPRVQPVGKDAFPDVPRFLADMLADPPSKVAGALTRSPHLAPFIPSAKAWGEALSLTLTQGDYPHVIVMAGAGFIGGFSTRPLSDEVRAKQHEAHQRWLTELEPLRRPVPTEVPADVVEALKEEAQGLYEAGVTLTVTTSGGGDV